MCVISISISIYNIYKLYLYTVPSGHDENVEPHAVLRPQHRDVEPVAVHERRTPTQQLVFCCGQGQKHKTQDTRRNGADFSIYFYIYSLYVCIYMWAVFIMNKFMCCMYD